MGKRFIRLQFHFTSEQPVHCAVTLPIIWLRFPANRMSRSWKARRLSATSFRAACRAARLFLIGSSETRHRPVSHQICIRNSRPSVRRAGEDFLVATERRGKRYEDNRNGTDVPPARPQLLFDMLGYRASKITRSTCE